MKNRAGTIFISMSRDKLLQQRFESYLCAVKGLLPESAYRYRAKLKRFLAFIGQRSIPEIKRDDITQFLTELQNQGASRKMIAEYLGVLRAFFRFIHEQLGLIEVSPVPYKPISQAERYPSGSPTTFSLANIERLFAKEETENWQDQRDKSIFSLIYYFGIRPSAVVRLNIEDISRNVTEIYIRRRYGMKGWIKLEQQGAQLQSYLQRLKEIKGKRPSFIRDPSALFINDRGGRVTDWDLNNIFRNRAREVGLSLEKGVGIRNLRFSYVVHQRQQGISYANVVRRLGQKLKTHTPDLYVPISFDHKKKIIANYHPRG